MQPLLQNNPARLYSTLAPWPVKWRSRRVQACGPSHGFGVKLNHRPGVQEQNALQLREAITNGSWNPHWQGGNADAV
jgi:hypothetical protein